MGKAWETTVRRHDRQCFCWLQSIIVEIFREASNALMLHMEVQVSF